MLIEDIDNPVDPKNAAADIVGSSNGYSQKYFYTTGKLIETENLPLCGELIMVYNALIHVDKSIKPKNRPLIWLHSDHYYFINNPKFESPKNISPGFL